MPKVFISHRSPDDDQFAGRLRNHLVTSFGDDSIVKVVNSTSSGIDAHASVVNVLDRVCVVLVVIGKLCFTLTDNDGNPRVEDPDDHMRLQVEIASRNEIPLIPVLVSGASMPQPVPSAAPTALECESALHLRLEPELNTDLKRLSRAVSAYLDVGLEPSGTQRNADIRELRKEISLVREIKDSEFMFRHWSKEILVLVGSFTISLGCALALSQKLGFKGFLFGLGAIVISISVGLLARGLFTWTTIWIGRSGFTREIARLEERLIRLLDE